MMPIEITIVSSSSAVSSRKRNVALCASSRDPNELIFIFSYVKAKFAKLTVTIKMLITSKKSFMPSAEILLKLFCKFG